MNKPLAGVASIDDGSMTNRSDTNGLSIVSELIENPISTDPQRVQPMKFAAERVASSRLALQQAQRVLNRVNQRPVEFEQLLPSSTGENEPGQGSAGGRSAFSQLAPKVGEGNRFVALDLGEASLQSGEGVGVGENIGSLL